MVGPHPVHIQMGVARQDELVFLRRLGAGHQQLLCLAAGTFRQNAVQLVAAEQIGQGSANSFVKRPFPLRGQTDGELQLA